MNDIQQPPQEALEEWCCRGCDSAFFGTPPWHRLCDHCLDYLDTNGFCPDPEWPADEVPPLCPCCDKMLIPVIPAVLAGEVTGDGG
jgi:hypothetical protein